MRPDDATADNSDVGGPNSGNAADQEATPAVVPLKRGARRLNRETSGDLAHRRQEWETARGVGDRLESDRGASRIKESLRLLRVWSEVQVREEDLPTPQERPLVRLRFLNFYDQVRGRVDLRRVSSNSGAGRGVDLVGRPDPSPAPV